MSKNLIIDRTLYEADADTLLAVLKEKFDYLENALEYQRREHTDLCVKWVQALGNPANPEQLDKAIAEPPTPKENDR